MTKKIIYYATGNTGKFAEVKRYIQEFAPQIELKQLDNDFPEIQTMDQRAIALDKAKQAYAKINAPVLIDDSGIYFEKYKNFPGTLTKFIYHGIGYEGLLKLAENSRATFLLYMLYTEKPGIHFLFEGKCEGKVVRPESFEARPGLPYDAIFLPDGSEKTYAQLRGTPQEHEFAYRLRAVKKFVEWYQQRTSLVL